VGTEGSITIARPWWAGTRLTVRTREGGEELLDLPSRGHGYTHEAEAFMDLIRSGRRESTIMPLAESRAVLRTMDAIRARWGLRYPSE
jgi:predicted dehydrogenase